MLLIYQFCLNIKNDQRTTLHPLKGFIACPSLPAGDYTKC